METMYKYIGYFFLVFIVFVALGFYYPYFSLFPDFRSVTTIIHIHTAALLLWIIILITQPLLITYKKYKTHQLIGRFTYFLMPVIIITCVAVLRRQYEEGIEQKMTSLASLKTLYTSGEELLFIMIYYSLAVFNIRKGRVAFHMRYMICLALEFIPPSFGRTLGYWLDMRQYHTYNISILLCMVILIALIIYDRQKKLNSTPYLLALSLFIIFHIGWYILGHPI
jgi:hypothetical protein